ncbi:cobalt ABC transporter ATP-binding protein, partial [Burkholderia multivorans]
RRRTLAMASSPDAPPPIRLLDEPTQGRDDGDMSRLTGLIAGFLRGGGAVLAATHDERWAGTAHRVVRLEAGRLTERRNRP